MIDWLPQQPYTLMYQGDRLAAAIALPVDPPGVAWIRLFACSAHVPPGEAFTRLLEHSIKAWQTFDERPIVVSLAMHHWFAAILANHGFHHHQDIVVLQWEKQTLPPLRTPDVLTIRPLTPSDLPEVMQLDNLCFEDIWQLSLDSLELAYEQASYATVGEINGKIVAYQLSSENPFSAHLSRIATHPETQGKHVGSAILADLLRHYVQTGIWQVTVNTQSNNQASLALYQSFGFELTGERYPVYIYDWNPSESEDGSSI